MSMLIFHVGWAVQVTVSARLDCMLGVWGGWIVWLDNNNICVKLLYGHDQKMRSGSVRIVRKGGLRFKDDSH